MPPTPSPEEQETFRFLRAQSAFQTLDDNQLKVLAGNARKMPVAAGTEIIRQGERGEDCFVLQEGEVEVLQESDAGPGRVALLGPGAIFGEAALLSDIRRNATVRTTKPSSLYVIPGRILSEIVSRDAHLSAVFFDLFSLRDRPQRRENIQIEEKRVADGSTSATLKDRERGTYFSLSKEGLFVWNLLDGKHDLRALTLEYFGAFKSFAPHTIVSLLARLSQSGFIRSRAADALATKKWGRRGRLGRILETAERLLEWRFVIRNVDPWLTRLYRRLFRHLFTKPAQILLGAVAATGLVFFFVLGARIQPHLGDGSRMIALYLSLIPAFLLSGILHEAGHAFATKAFGREVHSIGFGWYWFGPIFYVDTSDMWLAPKWPRIAVSMAGAYADLLCAAVASLIGFFIADTHLAAFFWVFALASYAVVVANLNPLMEFDGYYVLADLLEKPNLRPNALAWFAKEFPKMFTTPSVVRGHATDILYGLFSLLYLPFIAVQAFWFYEKILRKLF